MKLKHALGIVLLVLIIDQWSKIYVKTHFILNEQVEVFSWFKILFVENEGAAWGTKIPGAYGKLFLTLFRIVAVCGIGYVECGEATSVQNPDIVYFAHLGGGIGQHYRFGVLRGAV